MMNRAYSTLEIKSVKEDSGIVEGIASTPTTDRVGDIMEPKGAAFKLPLPLLWQHSSKHPIGNVIAAKVTDKGIIIKAQIAHGIGVSWIEDAWKLIKAGVVRGLSIGFRGVEGKDLKDGGIHYTKWNWLELSAVTIPANAEASISLIKSIDEPLAELNRDVLAAATRDRIRAELALNRIKGLPVVRLKR